MNKRTKTLTEEQYNEIISAIGNGFVCEHGRVVKPNLRVKTALVLEANLGVRISDILRLRLSSVIHDGERYRLDIVEQKTGKRRTFTVPTEIYIYMQNYMIERKLPPTAKLFDITERQVNRHLKLTCDHLGIEGVGSHSFRKFFASSIYANNNHDINLVRVLLQHASTVTTQRYIGVQTKDIEEALQKHIKLL